MPCTSDSDASCCRKVLESTGLVGSWFFSCASIKVRKSAPPSEVALFEEVPDALPVVPVPPVPLVPVVPEPVVPVVPVLPMAAALTAACVPLISMISVPLRWF